MKMKGGDGPVRKDTDDSPTVTKEPVGDAGEEDKDLSVKRAEEWQQAIARQSEVVKVLKTKIVDAEAQLNRATVRRKSMEMGLFLSESEVLKLRALTKKAEDRATELANELKRVYQDLPKVMEKRVEVVAKTTNMEVKQKQLEMLKQANREEHFKFLDKEALKLESAGLENRICQLNGFCDRAMELFHNNRDVAKSLEKRIMEARESMGFLQQVWTKMVKRALEVQTTPQAFAPEDMDEGPELLLYRGGSGLDQCLDLLSMEGIVDLGSFRSTSPPRSPSPRSTSPEKLGCTASLAATQSTRVPSPSPSPAQSRLTV